MSLPSNSSPSALIAFAHRLADASGEVIRPYFRQTLVIHDKAPEAAFDPVTAADRAAEQTLRELIAGQYPDHGIIGEEFGVANPGAAMCWTLDPIDGTRAFIMGLPLWGTLIGLSHEGRPVLGLMDQPYTGERFWSGDAAAFCRTPAGECPLHSRCGVRLGEAMLAATSPDMFAGGRERERFAALSRAVRMTRYGGDCYAYCLLAMGFIDLVAEAGLQAFDIAPLIPIIEGAGGVVTTWEGGDAAGGGRILAAGDRRLHEQALQVLNG